MPALVRLIGRGGEWWLFEYVKCETAAVETKPETAIRNLGSEAFARYTTIAKNLATQCKRSDKKVRAKILLHKNASSNSFT